MKTYNCFMTALVVQALLLGSTYSWSAEQAAPGFTARPDRCIALNQGQVCYQNVTFTWQTPAGAEYCLYEVLQPEAVVCWAGNERSSHTIEFASTSSVRYQIRIVGQPEVVSEVTVEVAWVYRANRKSFSRWRLF